MTAALVLTVLAAAGVAIGVLLGQSRIFSNYLAAAGAGLLFGIALFWLLPETAEISGWATAVGITLAACLVLAATDHLFVHIGHASHHVALGPVLAATAAHSFLDGWSVQALATLRIASIAAPLGLALHKIPEGVAIGWIARRNLHSAAKAAAVALAVELLTLAGAYVEPRATIPGLAKFGPWWTAGVLAIVGGSFLFLGMHAVLPNRRRPAVMLVFSVTLLLVASIGLFRSGNI